MTKRMTPKKPKKKKGKAKSSAIKLKPGYKLEPPKIVTTVTKPGGVNIPKRSLANLRPIQKGEVRNRVGNYQKKIPDLRQLIADIVTPEDWEKLIRIIKRKAQSSPKYLEILLDRSYGRAVQTVVNETVPTINITHELISMPDAIQANDETVGRRIEEVNRISPDLSQSDEDDDK